MQFTESEFMLRNAALHSQHCNYIERTGITSSEKTHFSTTYGVNRRSDLAELDGFDVTDQLPQDIMHLFLEGVCVLHTASLLKHLIYEEELFTLDSFNAKMKSYKYLYFETKPTPLTTYSLRDNDMTGSQTSE